MYENNNKQNDKDKDKGRDRGKEKDREGNVLTHLVDAVSRKSRDKNSSMTRVATKGETTITVTAAEIATATMVLCEEIKATIYKSNCASFQSEIFTIDVGSGELRPSDRSDIHHQLLPRCETPGTQRVFKKTSPNSSIALYLPSREIVLQGTKPTIVRGIVFVDPKTIQGYRIYAQLTLTFRYGREDEEVMGLRFSNEAIMSLHQIWPRAEEPSRDTLTPLQDALIKRLGEGAFPFALNLTSQAPPSVQLVPAKRYYGAPIGTSYDVRCFIADKTDEKFQRRASVRMGVRVIYRTNVNNGGTPKNFTAAFNSQNSPPVSAEQFLLSPPSTSDSYQRQLTIQQESQLSTVTPNEDSIQSTAPSTTNPVTCGPKPRKNERGDTFPKLRLSPKTFRFSSRFGRSKSEVEKSSNDPFDNYSKSFQEYESGRPEGSVDKPFLLHEGKVCLRASLDKAWYTHGEDVNVNVNIRNDSRKTVRKVRVCAIQHVDVCMFNNGKFKNIVADSDANNPCDRTVSPGGSLISTFILKPQRGVTKNWIALEDTLQRSTEPEEITGVIAASAFRSPVIVPSPAISTGTPGDRNVFAIYVSYYVKVKLTLSGMGGELSLKLPFALVHVDDSLAKDRGLSATSDELLCNTSKLTLSNVPVKDASKPRDEGISVVDALLKPIDSIEEDSIAVQNTPGDLNISTVGSTKRRLVRGETVGKNVSEDDEEIYHKELTETTDENSKLKSDLSKESDVSREDGENIVDERLENSETANEQTVRAQVHTEV